MYAQTPTDPFVEWIGMDYKFVLYSVSLAISASLSLFLFLSCSCRLVKSEK